MAVFLEKTLATIGLLAFCCANPSPIAAQTDNRPPTIRVDPAACRYATRHQPAADVEYRPGVDVHGKPVAPADLPDDGGIQLPDSIDIAITADIARRLGVPANPLYRGEAQIGTVTLQGDKVLFNGRPLQSGAEVDLIALCRQTQR